MKAIPTSGEYNRAEGLRGREGRNGHNRQPEANSMSSMTYLYRAIAARQEAREEILFRTHERIG